MDIVVVTYNSEQWIERCLEALAQSIGYNGEMNIYIVDNQSSDSTCEIAERYKNKDRFTSFHLLRQEINLGFGRGNNIGALKGRDDVICFINVDTEIDKEAFSILDEEIKKSDNNIAIWEMRQMPYEHPKLYDPVTRETSWTSGAAFAIRRDVFEEVKGFDEHIFMYAEDVDLSWRVRSCGYKILYCPKVMINHYSYNTAEQIKPLQYLGSLKNNLLLRHRYGNWLDIKMGELMYGKVLLSRHYPYPGVKTDLLKKYIEYKKERIIFDQTKVKKKKVAKFYGWDYEFDRDGSYVESTKKKEDIKVSIIVRTCQRPKVLRETLISLRNQTYSNFEIVVVEDGKQAALDMIKQEFSDLNIRYYATGERKGRSFVGNLGLEKSEGDFCNFLDDDDLFFADHIETLVSGIENEKELVVYSYAVETSVIVESVDPYQYRIVSYNNRYRQPFDRALLCHHNYIPIECVLFSRSLYEKYGGFDTELEYLEDWDLWLKYSQGTGFKCIPKTTSLYKVPYKKGEFKKRQSNMDECIETIKRKQNEEYYVTVSMASMADLEGENIWQKMARKLGFKH